VPPFVGLWSSKAGAASKAARAADAGASEVLAGGTDAEGIMAALLVLGLVAMIADAFAAFGISRLAAWSAPTNTGGG
jgi:hypothetical protein